VGLACTVASGGTAITVCVLAGVGIAGATIVDGKANHGMSDGTAWGIGLTSVVGLGASASIARLIERAIAQEGRTVGPLVIERMGAWLGGQAWIDTVSVGAYATEGGG
jgi:hypothetical protein